MKKIVEGKIIRKFRAERDATSKITVLHTGVDLDSPLDSPIYSPVAGVVVSAHYNGESGHTLVVIGDDGNRYGYCHLSRIDCRVGERVVKGANIALSGDSGHCQYPHLHFSVQTGGQWVEKNEIIIDDQDFYDIDEFNPEAFTLVQKAHYRGGHYINPLPYIIF